MQLFNLHSAMRGLWWKRSGNTGTADDAGIDYAFDNNAPARALMADGVTTKELFRLDSDNAVRVGGQAIKPLRQTMTFRITPTAKLLDQVFFIAPYAMVVEKIEAYFDVTNTGAFTGTVKKMADGVTLANGTALHTAINLAATARTDYTAVLSTTAGVVNLAYKDRLGFDFVGTLNGCAGIVVTITFTQGGKGDFVTFFKLPAAEIVSQHMHLSLYPQRIKSILFAHMTSATDSSAVTALVGKCTGTTAAASATTVMGAGTTFNCKGTINTVQVAALAATADLYRANPGDRLSVVMAGVVTALTGVVIVVTFDPDYGPTDRVTVRFKEQLNADMADCAFFIANQDYEIVGAAEVHSTAFAGSVDLALVRDADLDAPGAGTDIFTTGWQGDGTAETVQFLTPSAGQQFLLKGDRLSIDYTATTTGVGALASVALKPV